MAILALVGLIVLEVTTDRFEAHDTPAIAGSTGAATTRAAALVSTGADAPTPQPPSTSGERTTATETAVPEPAHARNRVRLTLGATADSWIEARSGSADGDVLYSGIIPQGSVKRFSSWRVWVRFGAAANLTARLNGGSLQLPPGTYSAFVGARGLRPLGG